MENINIVETIQNTICTESSDGQKVYDLINNVLKANGTVNVSFMDVEILTVAFLNSAIGQLYSDYSEEYIKANLSIDNLSLNGTVILKHVVDTAKLVNKDSGAMQQSIKDILGEE